MTGSGSQLRAHRQAWPAWVRPLWFGLRPACTLVAVAGCVLGWLNGANVFLACTAAVAVLTVRPIRRPWIGLVLAVAVWPVGTTAATAVAVRAAVSVAAICLAGRGWQPGLDVVVSGRQALTEVGTPEQVEAKLRASLQSKKDTEAAMDHAFELLVSAWTTADARRLGRTAVLVSRGLLFWRWPYRALPATEYQMLRMAFAESVSRRACQLVAVATTIIAVALLELARPTTLFGLYLPAWVAFVLPVIVAVMVSHKHLKPPITGPVLLLTLGFLAYRWQILPLFACAAVAGLPVLALMGKLETRLISSRDVLPGLPPLVGGIAVRDRWAAAQHALAGGRFRVARRLWIELAEDESRSAPVRAAAYAALSHIDLGLGVLQRAVDNAERALSYADRAGRVRAQVYGTAGRVLLAAGDARRANELLGEAVTARRQRRDPLVTAARAQLVAMSENPGAALDLIASSWPELGRGGNLRDLIDAEVAVATVLVGSTPGRELEDDLIGLLTLELDDPRLGDAVSRELIRSALARVRLLLGRLQLADRRPGVAASNLRYAVNALSGANSGFDQAVARILLGAAVNQGNAVRGLPELTAGVRQLESLRGQLAMGQHRKQLVARHQQVYGFALDALERLQYNEPDGARLAAELVESLRRGALARMLRERTTDLSAEVRDLRDHIAALESHGLDEQANRRLDEYRDQLATKLSAAFASAYLPEPVDLDGIRDAAGSAHCVAYHLRVFTETEVRGHVVWTKPDGGQTVRGVVITDPALLAAIGAAGDGTRGEVMITSQEDGEFRRWRALSDALLPAELRAMLLTAADPLSLLVVPDSQLAAFPWAALRLDDGRVLIEAAILTLVPTLAMLDKQPIMAIGDTPTMCAYLDPELRSQAEQDAFRDAPCQLVASRELMLAALETRAHSGIYVAAHGGGLGLGQHMIFHDHSRLSAATALDVTWPPWVLFASCFVGTVRVEPGDDPLGLPISCLLGGAQAVIGGVIAVNHVAAGKLCSAVAARMLGGHHPAVALRDAQLAIIRSRSSIPTLARWAGFVCVSRVAPA